MPQLSITPIATTLTTSTVLQYTVPANTETNLTLRAVNTSASNATITVWSVPPGATLADNHRVVSQYTLQPYETRDLIVGWPLPPGHTIHAGASANSAINIQIVGTTRSTT